MTEKLLPEMPDEVWAKRLPDGAIYDAHGNADRDAVRYVRADLADRAPVSKEVNAKRKAALRSFEIWLRTAKEYGEDIPLYDHRETIRADLSVPSVQEVTVDQLNEKLDDICDRVEEMHKDDLIKFLQSFPNGLRIVRGAGEK